MKAKKRINVLCVLAILAGSITAGAAGETAEETAETLYASAADTIEESLDETADTANGAVLYSLDTALYAAGTSYEAGGGTANGGYAVAIGDSASAGSDVDSANAAHAVAVGAYSNASGIGATAVGSGAAAGEEGSAFGASSSAADSGVAVGSGAAAKEDAVAVGAGSRTTASGAVSVGFGASSGGKQALAIGYLTQADGDKAMAIGSSAVASAENSMAIGSKSKVYGANSAALGSGSYVSGAGSAAIGYGSRALEANVVSFGYGAENSSGYAVTRRLINVSDGTEATDAATYGQLQTVQSDLEQQLGELEESVKSDTNHIMNQMNEMETSVRAETAVLTNRIGELETAGTDISYDQSTQTTTVGGVQLSGGTIRTEGELYASSFNGVTLDISNTRSTDGDILVGGINLSEIERSLYGEDGAGDSSGSLTDRVGQLEGTLTGLSYSADTQTTAVAGNLAVGGAIRTEGTVYASSFNGVTLDVANTRSADGDILIGGINLSEMKRSLYGEGESNDGDETLTERVAQLEGTLTGVSYNSDTKTMAISGNLTVGGTINSVSLGRGEAGNILLGDVDITQMRQDVDSLMNGETTTGGTVNDSISKTDEDGNTTKTEVVTKEDGLYIKTEVTDKDGGTTSYKEWNVGESLDSLGEQISQTNEEVGRLTGRVNEMDYRISDVGAMAAAMSSLKTLGYNPAAPTEISAGIGHYDGHTAYALGIFHNANENLLFNAQYAAAGSRETMISGGFTVRIGSGTSGSYALADKKLSEEELQKLISKQVEKALQQERQKHQEEMARLQQAQADMMLAMQQKQEEILKKLEETENRKGISL